MDILFGFLRDYGALGAVLAILITNVVGLFYLFANGTIEFGSRRRAAEEFYLAQIKLCQAASERRIAELTKDGDDLTADRDDWRDRAWRAITAGERMKAQTEDPPRSEFGG